MLAAFTGGLVLFAGFVVLVDPHDTGRFSSVLRPGTTDETPRTANVSRGRDPRFNAAIIGNSYSQLLDPARLSASTGLSFVQMTVPGTGPREHVTLLGWFLRNHARPSVVVMGLDETWCVTDPALPLYNPFPFWLYSEGPEFYARHLSIRTLSAARHRLRLTLGAEKPADAAGYSDYEIGRVWNFQPAVSQAGHVDMSPRYADGVKFPAAELLVSALAAMPAETKLVAFMPPQYAGWLSPPGSERHTRFVACKHDLMQRVSARPRSVFLDFFRDTPETRDPRNFMDGGHYRAPLARAIEQEITSAIVK